MYTPTYHVSQLPPRVHLAIGLSDDRVHASTPSYANASPYANAPANLPTGTNTPLNYEATRGTAVSMNDGWSMTLPDSGRHSGGMPLPTLAGVRGRCHPSQMPSSTTDTAKGTFASAARTYGSASDLALSGKGQMQALYPVPAQQDTSSQPYVYREVTNGPDALQQLKYAGGQENRGSTQSWLGGAEDASRAQEINAGVNLRLKEEPKEHVKMHGT